MIDILGVGGIIWGMMKGLDKNKEDMVYSALMVGMTLADAYIFASLSPSEIQYCNENEELQRKWTGLTRKFEFQLLTKLNTIIDKQTNMGREQAVTWLLEHTNPRYSGKPQNEMPELHLHIDSTDPANVDTVTIHNSGVKNDIS